MSKKQQAIEKSPCCNAEIDYAGGGYIGKEIAPIKSFCSKCGQVLVTNYVEHKVINIKTGKVVQEGKACERVPSYYLKK